MGAEKVSNAIREQSSREREGKERAVLQEQASRKPAKSTTEVKKSLASFWEALTARSGATAYIPIIVVVILMFCGASWQMFWPYTDAARYQCYALTFWLGSDATKFLPAGQCGFIPASTFVHAPFHMLPLEYPPLTLVIFSLALFAPIAYYQLVFALWMALTAAFIYWLLLRYGPRGAALTFAVYALVGAWATAEGRFDMVPAAVTLLCVLAAERKHWTAAYMALAFATLLKIYPILFLPALFIAEQRAGKRMHMPAQALTFRTALGELWQTVKGIGRWQWKNTLIFAAIVTAITVFFGLLNYQGAIVNQISYFTSRPIQIESTASSILWAGTHFGFPARMVYTFGSLNIASPLDNAVSLLFDGLFLLGTVYTLWLQWRGKLDFLQTCIALLLVFIATGKVFSPQYLMWVMPLLAYSTPLDAFWLPYWGFISLLTTIIYPWLYTRTPKIILVDLVPGFVQTVAVRDGLFVLLTLAYLFNWFQIRRRKPLPPEPTGKETRPLYAEAR